MPFMRLARPGVLLKHWVILIGDIILDLMEEHGRL